jgi:hypothetical protein
MAFTAPLWAFGDCAFTEAGRLTHAAKNVTMSKKR